MIRKESTYRLIAGMIFFFSLFANSVLAKQITPSENDSSTSQIKVEFVFGGIQYEKMIGKRTSLNFGVQYSPKVFSNPDDYDFQLTPEMRFYFSKRNLPFEGFYFGPYLFYKDYIVAREIESAGVTKYSADLVTTTGMGMKIGYSCELFRNVILDLGLGFGFNFTCNVKHKEGFPIIDESSHYFNATGGMTIGYAF